MIFSDFPVSWLDNHAKGYTWTSFRANEMAKLWCEEKKHKRMTDPIGLKFSSSPLVWRNPKKCVYIFVQIKTLHAHYFVNISFL